MFSVNEILKATEGRLLAGSKTGKIKGISPDTRTIRKGELFIATKGAKYDGHTFLADAFKKGAMGAVVSSKNVVFSGITKLVTRQNRFIISVPDTITALGEIARFHRQRFDIPLVAVTGSNGKTASKEMIAAVLGGEWAPLKNSGTLNNFIGLPSTLLELTGRNKSAVVELGMNRFGEIGKLSEISRPNIGVVTNIGPSHLEFLKDLEGIYRAKKELLNFLGTGDIAVLNNDDIFLRRFKKKGLRIVTFGIKPGCNYRATGIKREAGGWRFRVGDQPYSMPLRSYHDIYNALAAISVGRLFNVDSNEMARALSRFRPLEKRMTRCVFKGIEFLDDTYNSNPLSLGSAIQTLADYRVKGKRILVSGDMLELGEKAAYYHKKIGRSVARSGIDNFIVVGKLMRNSFLAAKSCGMKDTYFCSSKQKAAVLLKRIARPHDVILVKGSRATKMEDIIKCFITSSTH